MLKKEIQNLKLTYFFAMLLSIIFIFLSIPNTASAAESEESINQNINSISIGNLNINETMEVDIIDSNGDPATLGVERVESNESKTTRASNEKTFKVWYTGGTINAHFYMTVSNNRVTKVYDDWILVIGGTFTNDSLTRTSSTGKLTFTVNYAAVMSGKCWLKGVASGSNNDIEVSWKM